MRKKPLLVDTVAMADAWDRLRRDIARPEKAPQDRAAVERALAGIRQAAIERRIERYWGSDLTLEARVLDNERRRSVIAQCAR